DGLGLRVPPAIVLNTVFCHEFIDREGTFGPEFPSQLAGYVRRLEEATGRRFGGRNPLLVSVRSSPPTSMPGMLDTILNVGLTESTVRSLIRTTGNATLAWDAYRRLIRAFAETVHGVPPDPFDRLTDGCFSDAETDAVRDLDPLTLRSLARDSAELLLDLTGTSLPGDPLTQLVCAVEAVCRSWGSRRARDYRRLNGLDALSGTAVIIQAMVFGNTGGSSGSGVGFTRDPSDGRDQLYLDFLFNSQGEDVVSGRQATSDAARLPDVLPGVQAELEHAKPRLESEFRDMQDFEFTVQDGRLYFLQTRAGKRTPWAALQIAVDLVSAGIIDSATALQQLAAIDLAAIERVRLRPGANDLPIATGTPAGLGVAAGAIAFDSAKAQRMASAQPVILVRPEMSPEDIAGLAAARGVLTALGGRTSHAAVVARQMGKICVVGCRALRIDGRTGRCWFGDRPFSEGDSITIDGETGHVYSGCVSVITEKPQEALATIARWRQQAWLGPPGVAF
ncbi:MAG: PEP/pyruvate-binding domain-containing protein, partial [Vicinamibacterales bacterium]